MQSVVIDRFGEPTDVVHLGERPLPEPGPGEARVRMTLSPIHNHDLAIVRGVYGYRPDLPAVPGTEALGLIDALGEGVQHLRLGQRVASASAQAAWAECFISPAAKLVPVPDALPDEAACQLLAMPLSALMLLEDMRLAPGLRVYGYLPMGSYLVAQLGRVRPRGFVDAAAHRAGLAAVHNDYIACAEDPLYEAGREDVQALQRPLFTTSFLLDDFLASEGDFGAQRLLLSSASSKTAYGAAFCIGRRAGHPQRVGLTSRGNLDFVRSLGCYEQVLAYDELAGLDASRAAAYIDFAGSAPLRAAVHRHLGDSLRHSCAVGGSHWEALRVKGADPLPSPVPQLFFAPTQAQRRAAPPPQGLGPRGLEQAVAGAWHAFVETARGPDVFAGLKTRRLLLTASAA